MSYDKGLAERVREILWDNRGFTEKTMFGGICFLVYGNMACGVLDDNLIIRVGPDGYQNALDRPHTGIFDFTGRPMKGWVVVKPEGYESDHKLQKWVREGKEFALSLSAK